jgi:hypothetical protein
MRCTAHIPPFGAALALAVAMSLTACQRDAAPSRQAAELAWARAALERNPQLELLASDDQQGVLTVRNRSTGEVQAIGLNELAAVPVAQLERSQPRKPAEDRTAATEPRAVSAEPADARREQVATASAGERDAPARPRAPQYTIERSEGQIRVVGPGIDVVSTGAGTAARPAPAGQRTVDPIICEGPRMMHLDDRSIFVDGDAITARGGCELYITNSRIVASGTGIIIQDAVVHVANSHIEGAAGSIDAADSARVYIRGSTFQGLPRRTQLALVQDQGGNRWR